MSAAFLAISVLWTGFLAVIAEALTQRPTRPLFAQTVWRIAALFMALPWLGLLLAPLLPAAPLALPYFPDLIDFGIAPARLIPPDDMHAHPAITLPDAQQILLGLLILGWLIRAGFALAAHIRLHVLRDTAKCAQNHPFSPFCAHWTNRLRLSMQPKIALMEGHRSPFVSGFIRHTIYLPESLAESATATEHAAPIIAHECVHIARGDLITRPLERLIADLIWFSPFAWLARARLDHCREAVCDAQTVALTAAPIAYARALSFVARTARPMPNLPIAALILNENSILNKRKTLPMRIRSILEPTKKTSRARIIAGLTALLIAGPIALAQGLSTPEKTNPTQSFAAPIVTYQRARIVSPYGIRGDPSTNTSVWHAGIDIAGGEQSSPPIAVPADGVVILPRCEKVMGSWSMFS